MPEPSKSQVGQQVGNYRLIRLLGQGGFAEVYLGEHLFLKTQAAISQTGIVWAICVQVPSTVQ